MGTYNICDDLVGSSPQMLKVYKFIQEVAKKKINVLITGETGTGKELVARAIHDQSYRQNKPFIPINCAGIPITLLESELFGHEKGAFTGAISRKKGAFEQADGGTLFLDEIGDMNHSTQSKILRAIETGEFTRVGGEKIIKVDVRIIAATNKDIWKEVQKNNFRKDLYYRLNVAYLDLPPLRERKEDIPILVEHFIRMFNERCKRSIKGIEPKALKVLMEYEWDGNVRELKNLIERIVSSNNIEMIRVEDLPAHFFQSPKLLKPTFQNPFEFITLNKDLLLKHQGRLLDEMEKSLIEKVLINTDNNKTKTAKLLGISVNTLKSKIRKYKITSAFKMQTPFAQQTFRNPANSI
jgi:transcriptional regulator with PAS, ATPase and Fis domain